MGGLGEFIIQTYLLVIVDTTAAPALCIVFLLIV